VKKNQQAEDPKLSTLSQLLGNLKATREADENSAGGSDDEESNEEYRKILSRRVSMNEENVTGTNFEKYNGEAKPSQEIRRKIANYLNEYREHSDEKFAKEIFLEICAETSIARFTFVGYILSNGFSLDSAGWTTTLDLIVNILY